MGPIRSRQDGAGVPIKPLLHKKEINRRLGEGNHKGSVRVLPPSRPRAAPEPLKAQPESARLAIGEQFGHARAIA